MLMMRPFTSFSYLRAIASVIAITLSVSVRADVAAQTDASVAPASFRFERPRSPQDGQGAVLHATPARPEDWPSTYVFDGRLNCTATAVGPRAILTAAHCVDDRAVGELPVGATGSVIRVTCRHHTLFRRTRTADFALCLAGADLPRTGFEFISADLAVLARETPVQLVGYGCTDEGRRFGTLYEGPTYVTDNPSRGSLFTKTAGGAAVCEGDSGGAAYVVREERRVIIGVNARGDFSRESSLATTATWQFVEWAQAWSRQTGAGICGLSATVDGCRR
jgi:hypothetical protein